MNTPLTDKVRYKCNDIAQIADAGFRGAYEAMTAHAEGLELEIKKERTLADRLAAPLFFNEHEALAGEDLEWTPAHVEAVKAWKEARHDS